jgi:hypothetical protein
MKSVSITLTSVAFIAGALVTYLVVHSLQSDMAFLSLVVGAILGTQAGVLLHHRVPEASLTSRVKACLGVTIAVTGIALSLVMQHVAHSFRFPEVSIPIGAVGCFVFPFVISDNLWRALEKSRRKGDG